MGKHSLHDVARKVLDLCNERVEAYKAHLIELSKAEIKPTYSSKDEAQKQRQELDAAGKMQNVKPARLKSVKKEESAGLQHEVPKAPMAMKTEKLVLPGHLDHQATNVSTKAVAAMPTPPAVPPQLKSEMDCGKKTKLPRKSNKGMK